MNTTLEFTAWTRSSRSDVYETFEKGFQQFHRVIERFSRFNKESELSKLNNSAGKKIVVSKELFALIKFALDTADKTKGAFDPTIIDFLETYGYGAKLDFDRLKNKERVLREIEQVLKTRPPYSGILLNEPDHTIKLAKNQRIDLGGIGKGYAIDLACKSLAPLKNYLINAGGDVRAKGRCRNKPWNVELYVPTIGPIGKIELENLSICCSGGWARKVKFFNHLINPKSGSPKDNKLATYVIHTSAKVADAWATALYIEDKPLKLIKKESLRALIAETKDKVISHGFPDFRDHS